MDLLDLLRLDVPVAQAGMGGGLAGRTTQVINAGSAMLAKLPDQAQAPLLRLQTPRLPVFSPIAPTVGMPDSAVDRAALYAGETVLRLTSVISAEQAVGDLVPG